MKEKFISIKKLKAAAGIMTALVMSANTAYPAITGITQSIIVSAAEVNGAFTEDTVLTSDRTYTGDVKLGGGILDLNGHTLTVGGDFTQTEGVLRLTHGTLRVMGNMTLRYGGGPGHGRFECDYEDDVIDVDGNVLIDTDCESTPWQDDGRFPYRRKPYCRLGRKLRSDLQSCHRVQRL